MGYIINCLTSFDFSILNYIQYNFCNKYLDVIMKYITLLGEYGIVWIIITIILLLQQHKRKYGIMLAIALVLCLICGNLILKPIIARQRPFNVSDEPHVLLIKEPLDYSFPSGHTLSSFACIVILLHYSKKKGIFFTILATLIAFSRIYLYVHYPTDIIAGVILGIILGIVAKKIYYFLEQKKIKKIYFNNKEKNKVEIKV